MKQIHNADDAPLVRKTHPTLGQGVNQIKHYQVIAHTTKDKKVTIAEDIDGEDLANQLKDFICKRLLITH